jgi:hypothetical protein
METAEAPLPEISSDFAKLEIRAEFAKFHRCNRKPSRMRQLQKRSNRIQIVAESFSANPRRIRQLQNL